MRNKKILYNLVRGEFMENFVCKIPTIEEIIRKYDYEINNAKDDRDNWIIWKEEAINRIKNNLMISYYGY